MPRRLRWNHNAHYHGYLLGLLPGRVERALDVGCGTGVFARALARRAGTVDAIDSSAEMVARARAAEPPALNVNWIHADALTARLHPESYDAIAAIASLHHMPLDPALGRLRALLAPGGVLVILGLYRARTLGDFALGAAGVLANPVFGAWYAMRRQRVEPTRAMPVLDPETTLGEVRAAADRLLPGAELRRHLFFRYSLVWRRER